MTSTNKLYSRKEKSTNLTPTPTTYWRHNTARRSVVGETYEPYRPGICQRTCHVLLCLCYCATGQESEGGESGQVLRDRSQYRHWPNVPRRRGDFVFFTSIHIYHSSAGTVSPFKPNIVSRQKQLSLLCCLRGPGRDCVHDCFITSMHLSACTARLHIHTRETADETNVLTTHRNRSTGFRLRFKSSQKRKQLKGVFVRMNFPRFGQQYDVAVSRLYRS